MTIVVDLLPRIARSRDMSRPRAARHGDVVNPAPANWHRPTIEASPLGNPWWWFAFALGAALWVFIFWFGVMTFYVLISASARADDRVTDAGLAAMRVIDGDTICLGDHTPCPAHLRVRIANIDAPEMNGDCKAERMLARAAKAELEALTAPGFYLDVALVSDDHQRLLSHVLMTRPGDDMPGDDIGEIMIERNLARPWLSEEEYRRNPPKDWCE